MQLKQLAGRLSAAQLASLIRSRRWLATASAMCVLILGLIVLFQPADDDGFAVEEVDFAEPQPDQGVLPLTVGSAGSVDKPAVWLTGTIEYVPAILESGSEAVRE